MQIHLYPETLFATTMALQSLCFALYDACLLDKLWDDVVAGPQPDRGLGRLRKDPKSLPPSTDVTDEVRRRLMDRRRSGEFQQFQEESRRVTQSIAIPKPALLRINSMPEQDESIPLTPQSASVPSSPALDSPGVRERENAWRSVFHPGGNKVVKKIGSDKFDNAQPNSPTVYDWVVFSGVLDR